MDAPTSDRLWTAEEVLYYLAQLIQVSEGVDPYSLKRQVNPEHTRALFHSVRTHLGTTTGAVIPKRTTAVERVVTCNRKRCGRTYVKSHGARAYCTPQCYKVHRTMLMIAKSREDARSSGMPALYTRKCRTCHDTFQAFGSASRFCSEACHEDYLCIKYGVTKHEEPAAVAGTAIG